MMWEAINTHFQISLEKYCSTMNNSILYILELYLQITLVSIAQIKYIIKNPLKFLFILKQNNNWLNYFKFLLGSLKF